MSDEVVDLPLLHYHSQLTMRTSCDKYCNPSIFHLLDMPRLFSPSLNFYIKKTNIKVGCQVFCLSSKVHQDWYKCKHRGRWVVLPFFFTKKRKKKKESVLFLSDESNLSKRSTRNVFKSYYSSYINGSLHNKGSFFLLLDSNGKQNT